MPSMLDCRFLSLKLLKPVLYFSFCFLIKYKTHLGKKKVVKVIEMKIKNVIIDEIVKDAAGAEQVQFPSGPNHSALLVSLWWI